MRLEQHLFAIFASSSAANELIEAFPECDLTIEMKHLLVVQYEILEHLIEGRHYGSNALDGFIEYTQDIIQQTERINDPN